MNEDGKKSASPLSPRLAEADLATATLPFETEALRKQLTDYLDQLVQDPVTGKSRKLGSYKWGVYAFFDYDGEPIYVGQTNEQLRTRIRRHLTNRRTDAVAMNVLDPFEVCFVEVWPLPELDSLDKSNKEAKAHLDALEYAIFHACIENSTFKAILNEKDPPKPTTPISAPVSFRGRVVSEEVSALRDHPDLRIARRAGTMARLAQIIAERKVAKGLRRALLTQCTHARYLAHICKIIGTKFLPNKADTNPHPLQSVPKVATPEFPLHDHHLAGHLLPALEYRRWCVRQSGRFPLTA